jgi:hypothetical protein
VVVKQFLQHISSGGYPKETLDHLVKDKLPDYVSRGNDPHKLGPVLQSVISETQGEIIKDMTPRQQNTYFALAVFSDLSGKDTRDSVKDPDVLVIRTGAAKPQDLSDEEVTRQNRVMVRALSFINSKDMPVQQAMQIALAQDQDTKPETVKRILKEGGERVNRMLKESENTPQSVKDLMNQGS